MKHMHKGYMILFILEKKAHIKLNLYIYNIVWFSFNNMYSVIIILCKLQINRTEYRNHHFI